MDNNPTAGRSQVRHGRLRAEYYPAQINVHDPSKMFRGDIHEPRDGVRARHRRVVDQHVEATESLDCRRDEALALGGIADVDGQWNHAVAMRGDE